MIERDAYADKFEFVGGWLCLEFCNTINYANLNERLKSYDDLVGWSLLQDVLADEEAENLLQGASRRRLDAEAALEEARALRLLLHRVFSAVAYDHAPDESDIAMLNDALQTALAHLRIAWVGDSFTWSWSAEREELDRMLWPVVWSASELLMMAELARVKRCSGDGCTWLFLDRSRNHSRRWCEMEVCGNRAKARRHYDRTRKRGESGNGHT
jgi:predicted RNA-binding Zn ribbon-like protein